MHTFQAHPSLPSFILALLFFLLLPQFFFVRASSSTQEVSQPQRDCSPSVSVCGSAKMHISYPFWTMGRLDNCAYRKEFEISCNPGDSSFEIVIESNKYRVKEIDYENHRATIVDTAYFSNQDTTTCLRPLNTSTLNYGLFDYTEGDLKLTFLDHCSSRVEKDPYFKFLDCLSKHLSGGYAYVTLRTHVTAPFKDCQVTEITILERNRERFFMNIEASWNEVLEEGFEVTWSAIDPGRRCWECVQSKGYCGYNEASPAHPTCNCNGKTYPATCPHGVDKSKRKKLIVGGTTGIVILFLSCIFVFIVCLVRKPPTDNSIFYWKKKTYDTRNIEAFLENYVSLVPKRYQYAELKKMTNCFNDKLGQGGYGSVFKGKLIDGRLVAVKVLNNSKGGKGEEFINEVASIGRTYHVNVVTLLGFCSEGSKRALVYEFMSKGSLEKFIFSDKLGSGHALDCQKLFQIAVGIARGLEYLHRGCSTRIVHFDIKPHNILLDDNLCPKISDFGLAKLCPQQESTLSMLDARGTIGYIAPEVFCRNIGGVSHKSDVYSYGMMVLEMIGGRKNIDARVENTSEIYFPHWVYKHVQLKESLGLLGFGTEAEEEIARKMVLVGLWCIQTDPTNRPSMSKVVELLEGSLASLKMPPKPYLSSPSRSCSSTP
ncbi:hypothetical protein AAC387_Pa05g3167 [Persea americana]